MKVYNEILGNVADEHWRERVAVSTVEYIDLDQWTAQKSRFVARSDAGMEYAISLRRHARLSDGDIICYRADEGEMVVVRLRMSDVMVIDLGALLQQPPQTAVHIAVELGHALGNQQWPAVVQDSRVYVPLTVDRKVMASVMRTHHFEHVAYSFRSAEQIIPYLSPHEVRRLMGGAHDNHHTHG